MFNARNHLLADITTLVEIDAGKLIHVGFVREGVEVAKVLAAARYAERNAVRIVNFGVDQIGAEIGGGLGGKVWRHDDPQA